MATASTIASTFGHADLQIRAPTSPALGRELAWAPCSRLSSPVRAAASSVSADMPHYLLVEPGLDLQGPLHRRAGLDTARALDLHRVVLQHAAGTAAEQHHPVAEPDGLADLVGDEQHAEPLPSPDSFQQLVQQVAGHRVQ